MSSAKSIALAALIAPVFAITSASCLPLADGNSCSDDDQCAADEICTDVRECSLDSAAPAWRISWTIGGISPAADASVCDGVAEVELTISSSTESLSYSPLVCTAGAFGFRAIGVGYNTARVELKSEFGQTLASGRESGSREAGAELIIDLEL